MDKFICSHCGYSLTIKKTSNLQVVKLTTPIEFINSLKTEEVAEYDIIFDRQELENYIKKKKESERQKILTAFDNIINTKRSISKYILKCASSCGSEYVLEPETVIYSLNLKKQLSLFDDENIDLKLYDPTLPRTKDYECRNPECMTHSRSFDQSEKEAVIYRAGNTYHTKYACVVCKHSWQI